MMPTASDPAMKDEEGLDMDSSMEGQMTEDQLMLEPIPACEWIQCLGPDTMVWLVKEQCVARISCGVQLHQPGRMVLMSLQVNNEPSVSWEMDLFGRGHDGSQLIQPIFGWQANMTMGAMEGHDPIEFINNMYETMAYLYEQLHDRPFPGFQHGLPPEIKNETITRPVRLQEARGTRNLSNEAPATPIEAGVDSVISGVTRTNHMPQFVRAYRSRTPMPQQLRVPLPPTPKANMAAHPEIAVPHEVGVTPAQVAASKGAEKKSSRWAGDPNQTVDLPEAGGDDDAYRVTE